jgi:hypothetical protein
VTYEKNEPIVVASVSSSQPSVAVPVKNSTHLDDHEEPIEENNPRDSVEAYSNDESSGVVEQFRDSSIYQDRGSDLTLEETDHYDDNGENDMNNSSQQKSQQQQQEENAQDEIEQQAAFEYIREICSPTVSYSLQSDQWAHRKEGMELIQKYIERNVGPIKKMTEEQCNLEFKWICILIRKYFLDRVAPVYYSAYDCFRALLKVYSSYIHGREIEMILGSMVQPLLQNLGGESTGTNKRTQKEACRCILRIARLTAIDGLGLILNMLKGESNPSPSSHNTISTPTTGTSSPLPSSSTTTSGSIGIKQKLILLKILINEFSISESSNGNYDSGISTDLVMTICQVGINHSDDKIRKAAVDILCLTYQKVGKNVKMYMTDIKPAMLKVLEKKFIEIDNGGGGGGGALSSLSSFSSTAPAALMSSSSSAAATDVSSKTKSKKTENIRNLAPVVLKHATGGGGAAGGSFGGSRNKLLSAHLNSSFSGTAMLSKNADGEENFVVMKSPSKKNLTASGSSAPSLSSSSSSSSLRRDPVSRGSENDKENDSHLNPHGGIAVGAATGAAGGGGGGRAGGVALTPVTNSKNRFEISEDLVGSPAANKKDKRASSSNSSAGSSKGNPLRPQQQQTVTAKQSNVEDNRFYIDESQF